MPDLTETAAPWSEKGTVTVWIVLAPLVLWALSLLIVPPWGDFPLNDDWIYADTVAQWLETGHYTGHPFATASLVAQAGWGTLFCWFFGFSFEVLRWSTLILWAVAAVTTGQMAKVIGAERWAASLAGCLVIANPLAMNLGYTFMTDVPFLALMALSGYGYLRAFGAPHWKWLLFGSLFGAGALLIRQFAPLVLVAFVIALAPNGRYWRNSFRTVSLAAFLGPWLVAVGILYRLPNPAEALGHTWVLERLGDTLMEQALGAGKFYGGSLVYGALFVLPLLLAAAWHWYRNEGCWKRRILWTVPLLTVLTLVTASEAPRRMPYLKNILHDLGLGPLTLRGDISETGIGASMFLGGLWWFFTLLGLMGGAWMLLAALIGLRNAAVSTQDQTVLVRRCQQRFLVVWAVLMILALYHPWLPVRFDRYLLGAFLPLLVVLAGVGTCKRIPMRVSQVVLLLAGFAFCLAAQHDYLAWNRVRWQALDDLLQRGVPTQQIDGGYEFNGWYTSQPYIDEFGATAFFYAGPKGWWVLDDTYAIGWEARPGYEVLEVMPYNTWLGPKQTLLVLRRL